MKKYISLNDFEYLHVVTLKDGDFELGDYSASLYVDGNNIRNVDSISQLNDDLFDALEVHKVNEDTKSLVLYLNTLKKDKLSK